MDDQSWCAPTAESGHPVEMIDGAAPHEAVTFAEERFDAILPEIVPMWHAHWLEIGEDREAIPLEPDLFKYRHLDQHGHLLIVTARKAGGLIGYVFAAVDTHLHYASTKVAQLDLYYIAPEHRGGRTGLRLFQAAERAMIARHVVKVAGNTKLTMDQGRLFEAMGWRPAEKLFVKMLETS